MYFSKSFPFCLRQINLRCLLPKNVHFSQHISVLSWNYSLLVRPLNTVSGLYGDVWRTYGRFMTPRSNCRILGHERMNDSWRVLDRWNHPPDTALRKVRHLLFQVILWRIWLMCDLTFIPPWNKKWWMVNFQFVATCQRKKKRFKKT